MKLGEVDVLPRAKEHLGPVLGDSKTRPGMAHDK